ncbi:hypothetical protein DLAC_11800 [Tieghemostelium lacteum]|uniref:Coatomer subunit epsilon n=1 Tax=Tieghemostelium lacteum TaxID=361077 RepID=A0A151Z5T5_TIELA|nr:hypothetical protein DLAC_11800 [Tieghemostelium lacteum]|eukprot:KYQ89322.1 hypothetical protein DLAC_11800 [Tieghemostelium lacteum]
MADELLFESKNYYYLGNYQSAINEIHKKSKAINDKGGKQDADYYLYKSYISQGKYDLVQVEIKSDSTPTLQGLKLYASYLQSPQSNKDITLVTIKEWIKDGIVQNNYHLQVILASIYIHEQDYEEALKIIHQADFIEGLALLIQIYLKIDRLDLAEKAYNVMKGIDIDATPSLLSNAWIMIAQGDDKIKSALMTLEELSEKYGGSPLLLNGQAVCCILLKRFEKAETLLLESIEKNPNDFETISNLVNCYINMKKPSEVVNVYLQQLKSSPQALKSVWLQSVSLAEDNFERSKSKYAASSV